MKVIEINNLVKIYKLNSKQQVIALDNVTLDIDYGKIVAILGPNGAGKSTLFKALLKFIRITSGEIRIFNKSIDEFSDKNAIGYLPENFHSSSNISGEEFLKYFGGLSGLTKNKLSSRVDELLKLVGLQEAKNQKIRTYSKGMLQRLLLAQAIIHQPRLLLLDEPTDGLDPVGKKKVRNLLLKIREQGTTIIVNSHLLSEVELLADSIVILKKGKIVAQGNLMELMPDSQRFEVIISNEPPDDLKVNLNKKGDEFAIVLDSVTELKHTLLELNKRNVNILTVKPIKTSLEEVFFSYIGDESL